MTDQLPMISEFTAAKQGADGALVDMDEAEHFLHLFVNENPGAASFPDRWAQVCREMEETGSYAHTSEELTFGAQVAWRNSSRCIGRLYWRSLQVRDRRDTHDPPDVFAELVAHLRQATNGGRIRPLVTVFPPATPTSPGVRIWNEQLIRYAGWRRDDGSIYGDPRNADFTDAVRRLGWDSNGRSRFDLLPIAIQIPGQPPILFELPRDAVLEVDLTHPTFKWFADLGLRWHAVPAISNMLLRIGGISYRAAPFNGWYMGTEIGARNLADVDRYNMLPEIARRLGLDTSRAQSLWRDRALVEINVAVLHSFAKAGVTVADHHTESQRFLAHIAREARAGRITPTDWSWIVPPMSGAQTPVFHRYYDEVELRPNFYTDPDAVALATTGCPAHADSQPHHRTPPLPDLSISPEEPPSPCAG
jgi:nitric-oxide synthase